MGIIENTASVYQVHSNTLVKEANQGLADDYVNKMESYVPVRLKQIVPISGGGNTERFLVCKETDTRLFNCTFHIDGEMQADDDRFLTAEQLHLFYDLKKLQYNDQTYTVDEIVPSIIYDELVMKCDIYLKSEE